MPADHPSGWAGSVGVAGTTSCPGHSRLPRPPHPLPGSVRSSPVAPGLSPRALPAASQGLLSARGSRALSRTTLHPHSQQRRPSLGQVSPERRPVLVQAHLIRSGPPKTIFLLRRTNSGPRLRAKRRPPQREGLERVQPPHTGPTVPAAACPGLGVVNECSPPSKRVVTHPLCSLANGGSQRTMHVVVTTLSQPRCPRPPGHSQAQSCRPGTLADTVLLASCCRTETAQVHLEPAVFKAAPPPPV